MLDRLAREQQIAVLISAHDMNTLAPVSWTASSTWPTGRAAVGRSEEVLRTGRAQASSTASTSTCCTFTAGW